MMGNTWGAFEFLRIFPSNKKLSKIGIVEQCPPLHCLQFCQSASLSTSMSYLKVILSTSPILVQLPVSEHLGTVNDDCATHVGGYDEFQALGFNLN